MSACPACCTGNSSNASASAAPAVTLYNATLSVLLMLTLNGGIQNPNLRPAREPNPVSNHLH
eukprot:502577-Prymnesium_polylepis.1